MVVARVACGSPLASPCDSSAMSSCSSPPCVIQPVLDLLPECVNPRGQSPQPPRVDFLLEASDLIAQTAEILDDVFPP